MEGECYAIYFEARRFIDLFGRHIEANLLLITRIFIVFKLLTYLILFNSFIIKYQNSLLNEFKYFIINDHPITI